MPGRPATRAPQHLRPAVDTPRCNFEGMRRCSAEIWVAKASSISALCKSEVGFICGGELTLSVHDVAKCCMYDARTPIPGQEDRKISINFREIRNGYYAENFFVGKAPRNGFKEMVMDGVDRPQMDNMRRALLEGYWQSRLFPCGLLPCPIKATGRKQIGCLQMTAHA